MYLNVSVLFSVLRVLFQSVLRNIGTTSATNLQNELIMNKFVGKKKCHFCKLEFFLNFVLNFAFNLHSTCFFTSKEKYGKNIEMLEFHLPYLDKIMSL